MVYGTTYYASAPSLPNIVILKYDEGVLKDPHKVRTIELVCTIESWWVCFAGVG